MPGYGTILGFGDLIVAGTLRGELEVSPVLLGGVRRDATGARAVVPPGDVVLGVSLADSAHGIPIAGADLTTWVLGVDDLAGPGRAWVAEAAAGRYTLRLPADVLPLDSTTATVTRGTAGGVTRGWALALQTSGRA